VASATDGAAAVAGSGTEARLGIGSRLGHYEILGDLGAGAMGVVYRAWDTVLEREVAIKVLPAALVADPERVAFLEREAQLLASVSHPNVAQIHSLEEADGVRFPVLELVEGLTLEARLRAGGMNVREALEIARQVAAGLEAAHERGIVHRDLKPANIKITPKGQAKVLDFGLATSLVVDLYQASANSPTRSIGLRGSYRGAIVGTVAYMSPEQARGLKADKRGDIWSFGCVLYEVLTGHKAFDYETVAGTLEGVAEKEPDWGALPPTTPRMARSLVRRCLQKDPDQRVRDIADVRLELEEALSETAGGPERAEPETVVPGPWRRALPWSLAALATAVALGSLMWTSPAALPGAVRLLVEVQPDHYLTGGHAQEAERWGFQRPSRSAIALSPDGEHVVYAAATADGRQLFLRAMGQDQATSIPGTEGGSSPFFSPDGQWVGFFASGAMKKVPLGGGEPRTIVADAPAPFGASWADTDEIVFAAGELGGLFRVSASGGDPEPLTAIAREKGETAHRLPHMLPGGAAVLYTVLRGMDVEDAEIVVQSLDTGQSKVLIREGSDARFVPTGHLVFARSGSLMAAPFSLERLEVTGEAVRVVEDVMHASGAYSTGLDTGAAQFDFSSTGSLIYVAGGSYPELQRTLVRVDRDGEAAPFPLQKGGYSGPELSLDGRQLAYVAGRRANRDVWVYDVASGTPRRLTLGESSAAAVWSPDGRELAFPADRGDGTWNLFSLAADGSGTPERLTTSDRSQFVSSWSSCGVLAFVEGSDIWVLPMHAGRDARVFVATEFSERWPAFSPDGEWLAYASDETGQDEVYVRPYPGSGPVTRISIDGGQSPAWSREGTELFFRNQGKMMAVKISVGQELIHERPRLLLDKPSYLLTSPTRAYDVAPDGRFVMVALAEHEPQWATRIRVVLNWFEELRQRVATVR
jgi:serine/threonine-protein kinase